MQSPNTNMRARTHTLKAWNFPATLPLCCQRFLLRISVNCCVPGTTKAFLHKSINMPKQKKVKKKVKNLQRMPALIYMHINSSHRWLHQIHTMCNSVICARALWGRSKHLHEATKLHHQHAHFCFLQMFVNCFIAEVLFTRKST